MTKKYKIELTEAELGYLGNVLSEKPYKEVSMLIGNINQQLITSQEQIPTEKDKEPDGKDSS
jgi:hypothetical protein